MVDSNVRFDVEHLPCVKLSQCNARTSVGGHVLTLLIDMVVQPEHELEAITFETDGQIIDKAVRNSQSQIQLEPIVDGRKAKQAVFSVNDGGALRIGHSIATPKLPLQGTLYVVCQFRGGDRDAVAKIDFERRAVSGRYAPRLKPISVNAMPRGGSSQLMRILSCSPDIAIVDQYPYEAHVATYYFHMIDMLSTPRGSGRGSHYGLMRNDRLVDHVVRPFPSPRWEALPEEARSYLEVEHVERLIDYATASIDEFYSRVGGPRSSFFAEKFLNKSVFSGGFIKDVYGRMKEVILLRDVRDVVCSSLSWRARKAGEAAGPGDEENSQVRKICRSFNNLADKALHTSECLVVKYHDMVLDTNSFVSSLERYLDVGIDRNELARITASDGSEMSGHVTSGSARRSVERWREDLSPEWSSLCWRMCGHNLEMLGFPKE